MNWRRGSTRARPPSTPNFAFSMIGCGSGLHRSVDRESHFGHVRLRVPHRAIVGIASCSAEHPRRRTAFPAPRGLGPITPSGHRSAIHCSPAPMLQLRQSLADRPTFLHSRDFAFVCSRQRHSTLDIDSHDQIRPTALPTTPSRASSIEECGSIRNPVP